MIRPYVANAPTLVFSDTKNRTSLPTKTCGQVEFFGTHRMGK